MIAVRQLVPRELKAWIWRQSSSRLQLRRRLGSGVEVELASFGDWCIYNDIFVEGEYDPAITAAFRAGERHRFTIVDLGANVGFFTLRVLDRLYHHRRGESVHLSVLLVEGSPRLDAELQRRTAHLRGDSTDLTILNGLVGKRSGHARFEHARSHVKNRVSANGSGVALPYIDLRPQFDRLGPIDLLKVDIEGSEMDFIAAYPEALDRTRNLVIEFHRPECPPEIGIERVRAHGFSRTTLLQNQGATETWLFSRDG